jgi:hypothetical protein
MQKSGEVGGLKSGRHSSAATIIETLEPPRHDRRRYHPLPELQLIYDTALVGLAFLTPDCRYVQINQRLTEICGISIAAATAAAWAGAASGPNLCWYYADSSRRQGFWDT